MDTAKSGAQRDFEINPMQRQNKLCYKTFCTRKTHKKGESNMYELIQHLIAFKYACKINHWSTDEYSKHLLFDRLTADIDTWVDAIAETYFMALDKKSVFKSDVLNPKFINRDLVKSCDKIISHLEELQNDGELNEGMISLLSGIEEGFLNKLALAKLT